MSIISGESPEMQMDNSYSNNGGVALFSVGEGEGGTITGGSGDTPGDYETSARIRWSITVDEAGKYVEGGITGNNGWMRENADSPFVNYTDQQLADMAVNTGTLNDVFTAWNADGDLGKVFTFMAYAWERYPSCVTGFAG